MDTPLTLAEVRATLYKEVDASDPDSPEFLLRLNEGRMRLINSGKWKGSIMKLDIPASSTGFITLPRDYLGVLSMTYRRIPRPVMSQFLPYIEVGPGTLDDTLQFQGSLVDYGDGYATQSDILEAGTLRVTVGGAGDAAKSIRLYGLDQNGAPIFDSSGVPGITVTTANPTVDTTQHFSAVTDILAPTNMALPWTLSVVNGGTPTQIGSYQPGESRPRYRRYFTGVTTDYIRTLCQRRFIPVVNETDWVVPGNISALRYILQMMAFEFAGQQEQANAAFGGALRFLNDEARISRAGAIPPLNGISEFTLGVNVGA